MFRTGQIGKYHPAYKNGEGRGYDYRMVKESIGLLGKNCQDCGSDKDVYTHHIDENPRNNNPENWKRLCRSCHAKLHWKNRRKFSSEKEGKIFWTKEMKKRKFEEKIQRENLPSNFQEIYYFTKDLIKLFSCTRQNISLMAKSGKLLFKNFGHKRIFEKQYINNIVEKQLIPIGERKSGYSIFHSNLTIKGGVE